MKTAIIFKSFFNVGDYFGRLYGNFEETTTGKFVDIIYDIVVKEVKLEWDEPKDLNALELYYSFCSPVIKMVSLPHYVYTVEATYGDNNHGSFIFSDEDINYDV